MKKLIYFLVPFSFFLVACQEKPEEGMEESNIVENIDLDAYKDQYHVGDYFQDTLMYIDGGVGARIAYDFVDKKGNEYRFGELLQDFDLIIEKTLEANPKYLNKIFVVGHRLMISKGYDKNDFAGDKAIDIITTIELLDKVAPFKIVPVLSEEEKLIEEYKKKYKYTYARFTDFSVGDLFHHTFVDDKENEIDFIAFEDHTYDLTIADPKSEFGEKMNLKYKNKYFHIFTKSKKMDPMGWGELMDVDVVVKMILVK
jgi:hypothetical protein